MAGEFVRQDIWTLEQQQPWHRVTMAYALAVREMRRRDAEDPTSWAYQTAVHWTDMRNPGPFRDQCQHNTWYFLPWHRMYLYWFERIVRSVIQTLDEVDEQTKATWALPYWDYWDPRPPGSAAPPPFRDSLPPAFRAANLPSGEPNPLFEVKRNRARPKKDSPPAIPRVAINRGDRLPRQVTSPHRALNQPFFSDPGGLTGGFGGPVTSFHHFDEDMIKSPGALEGTPHGTVHTTVGGRGGVMTLLNTSPGDPIFYLHHANIDRLWEVWLRRPERKNPTDDRWLSLTFHFHDEHGQPVKEIRTPREVARLADLGFSYADVSQPAAPLEAIPMPTAPPPEHPPELVGATDRPLELRGDLATVRFRVARPAGPVHRAAAAGEPSRVYLNLEDVAADENPGVVYAVYANVPDDDDDPTNDAHYVGNLPLFGVESSRDLDRDHPGGHGGLRVAFDITDLYTSLRRQGRWNEEQVTVTFAPLGLVAAGDAEGDYDEEPEEEPEEPISPVTVGRVSLFYQ